MQYLLYIIAIPFLYINYKIVTSDLKTKIIPNKYLGYLLLLIPFWWIYLFINPSPTLPLSLMEGSINIYLFIGQITLTFIISFILYYFGIWAAGDAKYLLVLSLFIPYIGIVPFIGNIALLTIIYLLGYFIRFYFGKCIFIRGYAKGLLTQIRTDLTEKWLVYKNNKGGKTFFIVLKWIVIFLIVFVSIRLSRIYLFNSFFEEGNNIEYLREFIEKWNIYLVFLLIGLFIGGLYLVRVLILKLKNYIGRKLGLNLELVGNIFVGVLFVVLISFISYEFIVDYEEISSLLFRVFTLYLGIYLVFKVLFYSYKITFGIAEMEYIDIKDLKVGDVVDKEYLVRMFGEQVILGAEGEHQNKKGIFYPNPKEYFKEIDNNIDSQNLKNILQCYKEVNTYFKLNDIHFNENTNIKILKTFSFAFYILLGFIITYFLGNTILGYIINLITETLKKLTIG